MLKTDYFRSHNLLPHCSFCLHNYLCFVPSHPNHPFASTDLWFLRHVQQQSAQWQLIHFASRLSPVNITQRAKEGSKSCSWILGSYLPCVKEMPKADTWKIQKNWQTPILPATEMTGTPYAPVKCIKDTSWLWAGLKLSGSSPSLRKRAGKAFWHKCLLRCSPPATRSAGGQYFWTKLTGT